LKTGQATESAPVDRASAIRPGRWRPRTLSRISIQSKVMVMLLVTSLASLAVLGVVEYTTGRRTLLPVAEQRLTQLREAQKRAVETLFADLTNSLIVYSRGTTTTEALQAFTAGFDQLANAAIDPGQQQAIANFYTDKLVKPIEQATGTKLDVDALLPSTNPQKYLQAHYTASPTRAETAAADAGDGSAWSAANARFDNYFREIATRFEYKDAVLLDTRGNVVYTVNKGVALGTNILDGPYRESNLRGAYQKAIAAYSVDFVWITDFQQYPPQIGVPTAWLVSPINSGAGRTEGVLALPLPITKVNRIMTADKQWTTAGMGATAETYLAGSDNLMRSDSRLFLQNPELYQREAVAAGTPAAVVDKALRWHGTTLVQPAATAAVRAAQGGKTGAMLDTGYLGDKELAAYGPLNIPHSDLQWSILATRDTSEAFALTETYTRTLLLTVTAMVFALCVVSMLVAQSFVRPIRRLQAGAHQISTGDYEVVIPVMSRDEIGDLTAAFNDMSRGLQTREALLDEQRKENDRLLLSLMPEQVVQRYRDGDQTIAQEHQDVTVTFADIAGLDEISSELSGQELVGIVDELMREFDSAAETFGVEPIRTLHNGYLASCGLNVPRLDSVHRTLDFAVEMQRIVERFNAKTDHHLTLRVGIHTGNVVSGLVGRTTMVYDMWGAAVNSAHQMRTGTIDSGIYVTTQVYEALRDSHEFAAAGAITVGGSDQPIWRLTGRQ
jgi:class 3 adenylate cyclase